MSRSSRSGPPQFELEVVVDAPPARVFQAFVTHDDLVCWCAAERSVAVLRPTGVYAITWATSERRDDVLGQLGGTIQGTVVDCIPDQHLFLADVYWQPPADDPLGPMALEIVCEPASDDVSTFVTIRQRASEDGPRWQRYFAVTEAGWSHALDTLKEYVESDWLYHGKAITEAKA